MHPPLDDYPIHHSLCCVLWRGAETSLEGLAASLEPALAELVTELDGSAEVSGAATGALTLNLADGPPSPLERSQEDGGQVAALVTLQLPPGNSPAERARNAWEVLERHLAPHAHHLDGYLLAVAVARDYERAWPVGERSPGIKQISLIYRKPELTEDAFLRHWHLTHTPLALEVHPLWRYLRGVVVEALSEGAPPYDAIVELQFREEEDVTDLTRFYGGDIANMKRIGRDVASFIDLSKIHIVNTSERVLHAPAPSAAEQV
ncbi:MAG: EthD family reductase [Myxococcales bacterium]|nr:EthD family reductase [Myxococcales bacterium]